MPVYKYFGHPARFHGKPLLHILCNLKEMGRGRVVCRVSEEGDLKGPSFYRILWAQPLMDSESKEGRVVAEKVKSGVRYVEPVDLSSLAPVPDFRLVAKAEEEEVCRWGQLRDFSPSVDRLREPRHFSLPPLLSLLQERNLRERGEEAGQESFLLPHYKTYLSKDIEVVELPGEERQRVLKHQETVTVCEGTDSYSYADLVEKQYPADLEVLARLPEEPPFPQPVVGMRLHKEVMSHQFKKKEEPRTQEHDNYFP